MTLLSGPQDRWPIRTALGLRGHGGPTGIAVSVHQGNVASGDDCRRVIREVLEQHGRLDSLVNNAGITIDKTILKLTDDDWHKLLAD